MSSTTWAWAVWEYMGTATRAMAPTRGTHLQAAQVQRGGVAPGPRHHVRQPPRGADQHRRPVRHQRRHVLRRIPWNAGVRSQFRLRFASLAKLHNEGNASLGWVHNDVYGWDQGRWCATQAAAGGSGPAFA